MADAARPTPRAHARTPLSPGATHNLQRGQFHRWPNMPPSCFSELLHSYHRPCDKFSRPPSRVDGAVLWLGGGLLAWVRQWERSLATTRACSSLLGWTDMVVIATKATEQCICLGELWSLLDATRWRGLQQLGSSFQQLLGVASTNIFRWATTRRVPRPWFGSIILVYERLHEGDAWRRPGWPNAAELLAERLRRGSVVAGERVKHAGAARQAFAGARAGEGQKTRTRW